MKNTFNCDNLSAKTILGVEMGYYRQYRKGHWRLTFYHKGERFDWTKNQFGEPLETEAQCLRMLAYIEGMKKNPRFNPRDLQDEAPFLFEKAVEIWIKSKYVSRDTLDRREGIIAKHLLPHWQGRNIKEIRKIHIDEFLQILKAKGLSDKTCYNIIGELKACLRYHRDSIPKFPAFPAITYQEKPIRWLTREQQEKVFEFIPESDRAIFTFQRYTGCRPNEARGLLRENIHHDKGIIVIATIIDSKGTFCERTKSKRIRALPIIPEIEGCLKPKEVSRFVFSRKGQPYTKRVQERIWHNAMVQANKKYGIPMLAMYQGTKHSFGMQRLNEGVSKDILQTIFGHTDKKSTEKYAKYLTMSLSNGMRGKVINMAQKWNGEVVK